jgi:hypothetical protein
MQSDRNLPTFQKNLLNLDIAERQQICKELRGIALQNTVISVAMDVQIRGKNMNLLQDRNKQV